MYTANMSAAAQSIASCPSSAALVTLLLSNVKVQAPRQAVTAPSERFHFIVVGAGTAGCIVAARLSENPNCKVLLLEAGGEEPRITMVPAMYEAQMKYDRFHWRLKTERSDGLDRDQIVSRGKMLGGSGAHNAMLYLRGNKYDFEEWERLGAEGWGYDQVLPYFLKSEHNLDPELAKDTQYHSTKGPVDISFAPYEDENKRTIFKFLEDVGLPRVDPNRAYELGYFDLQLTLGRDGQRRSTNRGYIAPNRNRPNLRVVTHALVQRVNINKDTKQAESVEYINHKGHTLTAVAINEVILSAGAYHTPHLLMLSGVGPAEHLLEAGIEPLVDLPGVGQNLLDHFVSDFNPYVNLSHIPTTGEAFADALSYTRGKGPWAALATYTATVLRLSPLQPQGDKRPYLRIGFYTSWLNEEPGTPEQFCFPVTAAVCYYNQLQANSELIHPRSAGYLRLNTSSPHGQPLIYQNVFSNEDDIRMQADGARWIWEKLSTSQTIRVAGGSVYMPDQPLCDSPSIAKYSQKYFECGTRHGESVSDGHASGTCKMGNDTDSMAVLDPQLRVRGVKGLRVVDASVFPSITSGNINVPVLMVGERGADLIKKSWASTGCTV